MTITTEALAHLSGTPAATIRSWEHRGLIQCSEPGRWDMGLALAVIVFAKMLRGNVSTEVAIQATLAPTGPAPEASACAAATAA